MIDLAGYTLTATLRRDSEFVLSRGVSGDGRRVLILVPVSERPAPAIVDRLSHEYALRTELSKEWAAEPTELHRTGGRVWMVFDDPGGVPLDSLINRRSGPLSTADIEHWLQVAIAISSAIASVHESGLIHKDINPGVVLVDSERRKVHLMGFGRASLLPREHQAAAPIEVIAGSFPYMAPEQTGRMNRSVDSRSDLYSLGVSLYQVFAGALPFSASDPMEWVHCHVARQAEPPVARAPWIPKSISDIIMKLLSKTAEERYQTALGVRADMQRCLDEWRETGTITAFPLGANDHSGRLMIPERLYGRERETRALCDAFERAVDTGTPELVLVSGYSGIGKSALVNQIHTVIVGRRGLFGAGKFDQHKRENPYATFAQAFHTLVRQILSKSERSIQRWREDILEAVGPNGRLLVDLIPQLELVIGEQAVVPPLPPSEAQTRFLSVFRRFIAVFAKPGQPLTLFFDDLQWMDAGSMKLLEHLMNHPEVRHLLVIGSYRDNEVDSSHPLMMSVNVIREGGAPVTDIVLSPLAREDLGRLIADALRCDIAEAAPLVDLVHDKTAGNPFFAIQFLTALVDEHLLSFDPVKGRWSWTMEILRARRFSDNVVELMTSKLERLPEAVQDSLRRIACLGNGATFDNIEMVYDLTREQVIDDAEEAVRAGFLFVSGNRLVFAHDRIQEAAYLAIPAAKRAKLHLRIGRRLMNGLSQDALEDELFDVLHQLNIGAPLIDDPVERMKVAKLNAIAGSRAKASTAYASARSYFSQAQALLPDDAWAAQQEETFDVHLELAECEYLVGNHDQAGQLFDQLHDSACTDDQRARVWRLRFRMLMVAGRFGDAVSVAIEALRQFGMVIPTVEARLAEAVDEARIELREIIGERRIADLVDLPECSDSSVRALLGVIADAIPATYHVRPMLYPLLGLKGIILSLTRGVTEDSCAALSGYSVSLIGRFEDIETGYAVSELALRLHQRFGGVELLGSIMFRHGYFVSPWKRPVAESMPLLDDCFRVSLETGNLIYASYVAYASAWMLFEKGEPLSVVLARLQKFAPFAKNTRIVWASLMIRLQELFIAGLQKDCDAEEGEQLGAESVSNLLSVLLGTGHGYGIAFYHVVRQITPYLMGCYDEAMVAAREARALSVKFSSSLIESSHHLYSALTIAALYPQAGAARQREMTRHLNEHRRKLKLWAENCPSTFASRSLLVEAEVASIEGRDSDAMRLYEEAALSARDNGQLPCEAIANERAAAFYFKHGLRSVAETYLSNARYCYVRWGAFAKVRQLDRLHPRLADAALASAGSNASFDGHAAGLDLMTVVKAQHAVSSEIVLNKLVESLLRSVVEHAGADRGLMILRHGGGFRIETVAITTGNRIELSSCETELTADDMPLSVFQYVVRTRERIVLDDAAANGFETEEYAARTGVKSILCLPVLNRGEVSAVLHLENRLATGAFTRDRVIVLDLLASQAAVSLENAILYAEMEERVRDRTRQLADSLETLRSKSEQVVSLLDNSGQGFLSFGTDMVVDDEYSRACVDMLNTIPAGRSVDEILWPDDSGKAELMRDVVRSALYEPDPSRRRLMTDLLPIELRRGNKFLAIEYKVLDNRRMMLVLTDVTEKKRLQEKVETERKHLEMIVAAVTDSYDFFDSLGAFRTFIDTDLDRVLNSGGSIEEIVQEIYRQVHTFKGLFNQFSFIRTPAALHDLEARLNDFRQFNSAITPEMIADAARSVSYLDLLDSDLAVVRDVLGKDFLNHGERILLTAEQAKRLRHLASNLLNGRLVDAAIPEIRNLLLEIRSLGKMSVRAALLGFDGLVRRVAERCEKEVAPLVVTGDDLQVAPSVFNPFLRSLGHVFRNAVDHGIEPAWDRAQFGKPELGTIACRVACADDTLVIEIADDGAGIDRDVLKMRAIELRGEETVRNLTDSEMLALVFADGISTRSDASEISGRGFGMAAVRAAVVALGGAVRVESEVGQGTRFTFTFPGLARSAEDGA